TLEHMSELNRSLLLLSKIDNHQFLDTMSIDVSALLHQTINEYRRMAMENRVEVTLHEEESPTIWEMNGTLAKVLIHNLYRNALVHNVESNGELHIYIRKYNILFINTGSPTPLDKEHIFDRFYKVGGRKGSSGLGLAIVSAICRHSSLHIEYSFVDGKHQFSLSQVPTCNS
ncbi:MAG: HAMP domain-containing histidine kinase, partial [Bacteroidaceae bacterium]|nr:HAMP domain-containing histidine kinase [Bacteroidaceae bacterium]